jgi:hypothetical protein
LVPTSRMMSSAIASGSENSFGIKCKPGRDGAGPAPEIGRRASPSYSGFEADIRL